MEPPDEPVVGSSLGMKERSFKGILFLKMLSHGGVVFQALVTIMAMTAVALLLFSVMKLAAKTPDRPLPARVITGVLF